MASETTGEWLVAPQTRRGSRHKDLPLLRAGNPFLTEHPGTSAGSPSYCPLCIQPVGHEAGSDKKRSPPSPCPDQKGLDCSEKALGLRSVKLQVWVSPYCSLCNYFFTQLTLINLPQASTHEGHAGSWFSGLC